MIGLNQKQNYKNDENLDYLKFDNVLYIFVGLSLPSSDLDFNEKKKTLK